LKAQLLCLKRNGYTSISFKQLDSHLNNHRSLPKKPILITFDDGYTSNYKYGFKILKELNMKAEINLIAATIHNNDKNNKFLSTNQIKKMSKSGLIEFGSHTYSMHSIKLLCKGKTENQNAYYKRIYNDFKESYKILKSSINKSTNILALPYGYYNSTIIAAAKKVGFNHILTIENGTIKKRTNLLKIPRVYANGYSTPEELLKKIIYQSSL
jgi:peptidoglycan/xylan/chitin deacetylase (PgdA/CDA1 family)